MRRLTRQQRRDVRLLWQAVTVQGIPDVDRIRVTVGAMHQGGRASEVIWRCFAQRLDLYMRANQVRFVSADPLSVAQQEQLAGLFHGTEAAKIGIIFSVDPAVIGGLRIEIGCHVTDLTLGRQLEIFKDALLG